MSTNPAPAGDSTLREVREAARRQAQAFPIGLVVAGSVVVAVGMIALFTLLDYRFHQDPHRIVKVLLGLAGIGAILSQPIIGLTALPIVTPFLSWMPRIPIPGVNVLNILLFAVFGVWAVGRMMRQEDVFRPSRLGVVIGLLFGLTALSIVRGGAFPTGYGYHVGEAVWALVRCSMTYAVYFIGLAMVRGERARRRMAWAIALGLLAEAVVTILYGRNGKGQRALGSFGQPNELGAFLSMFTAYTAALLFGTRRWIGKLILAGAVVLGSVGVLLSVSRGAFLALAVAVLYVGLRSSRILTLALVAVLLTSPFWAPDYVVDRVTGSRVESEDDEAKLEGSAQIRIDTWHAIGQVVTNHPLDGVGFNGLMDVLPETGQELGVEVKDTSHNTYLRFLAEMGLFGLLLFIALLVRCVQMSEAAMRAARSRFDRQLALGFGAATIALALSCLFGDRFFSILITGNFFMLGALVNDALLDRPGAAA